MTQMTLSLPAPIESIHQWQCFDSANLSSLTLPPPRPYIFTPQPDITAYELALVLALRDRWLQAGAALDAQPEWALIARHFTLLKES